MFGSKRIPVCFFGYLVLFALTIAGVDEVAAKKKFASVQIGPGAFSGSPEVLAAWIQYGTGRTSVIKCRGYRYTFKEELAGRKAMIQFWRKQKRQNRRLSNRYMDTLAKVKKHGLLKQYVNYYHFRKYRVSKKFNNWRLRHLKNHRAQKHANVSVDPRNC